MSKMSYIRIPIELFKLPFKGVYELSIFALIYNFKDKGLRQSNGQIAKMLNTSSRTVERAIARLRKQGFIANKDIRKSSRCLVVATDTMSEADTGITSGQDTDIKPVKPDMMPVKVPTSGVVTTDMTADHKGRERKEEEEEGKVFSIFAFVDYWNSKNNLPHIKAFTGQRQKKIQARMAEPLFVENWKLIVEKLSASSFATGHNQRNWKADIDWLLKNSNNYAKVIEGKYDNSPQAINNNQKPFTPQQEQVFLDKNTRIPTESEAEQLMKKVGLL